MTNTLFTCDKCRSANHTNEYRLNPANFSQLTLSMYASGGGAPHMMPGQAANSDNRNETFHICSECKPGMLAELDALVASLKG